MKGVILMCLGELVTKKFGDDKWKAILRGAGKSENSTFLAVANIDDSDATKVIEQTCKVLGITLPQAADAFGEYWACTFAPKMYKMFYDGKKSAKELISSMDDVHRIVTKNIAGARPPRFDYDWKSDNKVVISYKSHRGLIDILIGLIKGVGKYYRENVIVRKLDGRNVEVTF